VLSFSRTASTHVFHTVIFPWCDDKPDLQVQLLGGTPGLQVSIRQGNALWRDSYEVASSTCKDQPTHFRFSRRLGTGREVCRYER
jgi:hypothetical protein